MKNLVIASTSTVHGSEYLKYLLPEIAALFKGCKSIVFVPYARPSGISHDDYTKKAATAFSKIGVAVKGIHEFDYPVEALLKAEGVFVGGGNTFLLVSELYKYNIMGVLSDIVKKGTPYLGTSAGSVITGLSMQNTNDMPIIYPPSFATLGILPFNLNCHYLDPDPTSKHMGETRETRIKEFHGLNAVPVLGLREGSWLRVNVDKIVLKGDLQARLFEEGKSPIEYESGSDLSTLK
jgi:dipeptidase E